VVHRLQFNFRYVKGSRLGTSTRNNNNISYLNCTCLHTQYIISCNGFGVVAILGMLSQKCHYYFLILAVQLLTYIVSYFPVHQLLICPLYPHHSKMVVSCMPHNWGISIWQRTGASQLSVPEYTSSDFCRVAPPPIVYCWVFLLLMTVKVRASFTSSTWYLICIVVLWLQCLLLPLWPTQCWVCCIASLYQCLPVFLLTCLYCCFPHATSPLIQPGSMEGGVWGAMVKPL